ncbi:unannotated protein [freshwater metagenome]|uniref:Unannotated protein n=1 Tax=freshwater metagenome TaxID=449393 RepID=A0A6J6CB66_9ZZZZ
MRRNPVENYPNTVLVKLVNQVAQVVRLSEPRGRGEVTGDLVTPGRRVGVFHDRHEFNVSEAELFHVGDEFLGKRSVIQTISPGANMKLVDAHW